MSPFALEAGNRFETQTFRSGAARILDLCREKGRLRVEECRVVNISDLAPGASPAALAKRESMSLTLLKKKLSRDGTAPNLILKPRVPIRLLGVEHFIEPDVLVAADNEAFYRVVEVKSYPDRGGKTDPADIRSACRQAAVGAIALKSTLQDIGIVDPAQIIPMLGNLSGNGCSSHQVRVWIPGLA